MKGQSPEVLNKRLNTVEVHLATYPVKVVYDPVVRRFFRLFVGLELGVDHNIGR
jgi:hypothetical protein